jgi:hypothetical protein
MLDVSVRKAIDEVRKLSGASGAEMDKAIVRAINHVAGTTKTAARREIQSMYKLKAKDINQAFSIVRANSLTKTGSILAKGKRLPLYAFSPKQLKKGVRVNVMGERKLIPGAFLATMASGHEGVFARGQYKKDAFMFRKKRINKTGNDLPVSELRTTSIPMALSQDIILKKLSQQIDRDFPGRLLHEVSRVMATK